MTDLKPNEKTFWDAAFLAALPIGKFGADELGIDSALTEYDDVIAEIAADYATAACKRRRKVWEDVK